MFHFSMQTTLVCVTVLFSVICGNRLMDHRLLRSSSYREPFKPSNKDEFLNTIPKFTDDAKSSSKAKLLMDMLPSPCRNDVINYDKHELPSQNNCKENWLDFVKPEVNYGNYDGEDADTTDILPTFNEGKFYGNSPNNEALFDWEDNSATSDGSKMPAPLISTLPVANYKEFYDDLVLTSKKEMSKKRNGNSIGTPLGSPPARGCDCKVKNDLVDLGQQHFPRYLLNAICQTDSLPSRCWSGSVCRPLEYKVKVLTFRTLMDNMQKDLTLAWLPDDLRQIWKFKTVTVAAGCFCS